MSGAQAHNTALASQLADAQATAACEKKLLHDQLKAAEQQWEDRIRDLSEQVCWLWQLAMPFAAEGFCSCALKMLCCY